MSYATDGKCHNAEPGTFGHECGKPAIWIGSRPYPGFPGSVFESGFCDDCRARGSEAHTMTAWRPAGRLQDTGP